jgi:hypothetical protein
VSTRLIVTSGLLLCLVSVAPVKVRHLEGVQRGFLVLRTLEGVRIADGELIQIPAGTHVTSRLTFKFRDGSVHEETTLFSQREQFRLMSHHTVQKGPTFPRPLEMSVDAGGDVTVKYANDGGGQKEETEHLNLPPDLANGLIPILLKNIAPDAPPESLPYVAATPHPRLVKLVLSSAGEDPFWTGGQRRPATHYVLKVDIGGFLGLLAPLVGKQPPDSHVWILRGEPPAFVRAEQSFYVGGPVWRIELESPVWARDGERDPRRER